MKQLLIQDSDKSEWNELPERLLGQIEPTPFVHIFNSIDAFRSSYFIVKPDLLILDLDHSVGLQVLLSVDLKFQNLITFSSSQNLLSKTLSACANCIHLLPPFDTDTILSAIESSLTRRNSSEKDKDNGFPDL